MKKSIMLAGLTSFICLAQARSESGVGWVSYDGGNGPGKGKHVVLLAGDEEYRSEESMPMLAKILSQRHGFKCTVLFSTGPDGTLDPNRAESLDKPEALDSADVIVMLVRFRKWPDETMKHFDGAILRGTPVVALRTSTHAFQLPDSSSYKAYNSFGKNILGEAWVNHWGHHKFEATRGVIEAANGANPLLRGVTDVFGDSDVYEAYPPADATILLRGQVLKAMSPTDPPAAYEKKRATDKQPQDINTPMMPVAWTRVVKNSAGKSNSILCTTMGAATDLSNEGLRRLVVNGVYGTLGLEVPAKADVTLVGNYQPSPYQANGFKKGVKASDHDLPGK
ncbi:MAG: ThuA domain-containing protein [Luteolibacter sp.]